MRVMTVVVAQMVGLLVLRMKLGRMWRRRSPAIGQRFGAIVAGSGRRGPLKEALQLLLFAHECVQFGCVFVVFLRNEILVDSNDL